LNIVPLGAVVDELDASIHELGPADGGNRAPAERPPRRRDAAQGE
jgi:hypothetical protein